MSARCLDAMRGRPEHRNEYGERRASAHLPGTDTHALPGDREWNSNHATSVPGNAVTGRVERFDLEIDQIRHEGTKGSSHEGTKITGATKAR
jgi:hypothetical protein